MIWKKLSQEYNIMKEKRILIYNRDEVAVAFGFKKGTKLENVIFRTKEKEVVKVVDSKGSYSYDECSAQCYPCYDLEYGIEEVEITFVEQK